ncbi:hypothetical protein [Ferrovibrio xuzhouensis]|uniref:Glycosyl transferase family 9 (Putative heptosyltransferase) n=1 Tax=Ferrovibrio xuzhouensis TaxID=1576914 RepID=A0ABV7VL59_9PROT
MVSGFLIADAGESARQRSRHDVLAGGRPRIGVAWRSGNADYGWHKSLRLADLAPVLRQRPVFWVDLQYGDTRTERTALAAEHGVDLWHDDAVDPLADLDAVAAQIAALDLVISVSNTAVHLAGALGVPTWLLLPPPGYGLLWYWSVDRPDSPFYPAVRGFRQQDAAAGWGAVVAGVAEALDGWLAARA